MMNSIYKKTYFRTNLVRHKFPAIFSVVTAFATTGETWSDHENITANERLKIQLLDLGVFVGGIDGFDPNTGHSEAGFIATLNWPEACDIGLEYKQDAIYFVDNGKLFVTYCDYRRRLIKVGDFFSRLTVLFD